MANPFLVLGGVVLGVVTAGIGILQVPGWIDSANDSAVVSDLGQIALAQEAALTMVGERATTLDQLKAGAIGNENFGIKVQLSDGPLTSITVDGDRWVAVSLSKSGHVFIRTSDSPKAFKTTEKVRIGEVPAMPADYVGPAIDTWYFGDFGEAPFPPIAEVRADFVPAGIVIWINPEDED
jgi:hypothetical protein